MNIISYHIYPISIIVQSSVGTRHTKKQTKKQSHHQHQHHRVAMESLILSSITVPLNIAYSMVSFFMKLWLVPINHIIEWIASRIQPLVEPLVHFYQQNKSKIVRISIYSVALVLLCAFISLINYAVLYSYFVPKVSSEEPLYFDFNGHRSVVATTEVAVSFQRSQLYDIYLNLEMPESPKNEDMGMFMVCLDLDSQDKWNPHKLLSVCRPATIKYRSPIIKSIKSVLMSIPYIFGLYEEKQELSISLVEDLPFKRFYQTVSASISILNKNIQIYSARLSFQAKLSGLEYYMYYYPILSFFIGFCSLFVTWMCIVSFILVSIYVYRHFNNPHHQEIEEEEQEEEEQQVKEKVIRAEVKQQQQQQNPLDISSQSSSSSIDSRFDPNNNNNNLNNSTNKKKILFDSEDNSSSDDLSWNGDLLKKKKKESLFDTELRFVLDKLESEAAAAAAAKPDSKSPSSSTPTSSTITPSPTPFEEVSPKKKTKQQDDSNKQDSSNDLEEEEDDGLVPEEPPVGQTIEEISRVSSIRSDSTNPSSSSLISSTTLSSSSSTSSEQESYGNSGALVNDEWHMMSGSDDGEINDNVSQTEQPEEETMQEEQEDQERNDGIRKRKTN
ncbi:hypothetical protein DFA_01710 [Cavenderia fasciculata]|uniref:Adipose-regulatory protein n=1 Tax=Cavenderia fasciculata TaxID=261658 RepID=F4PUA9_CACFS|nr:uncharacterized protein DFA_01710 [Cavenderia fasciculata]EGG21824.1 hypothetical protein DFA_01710 [Cavenderia fasciculata]|eukprot:XP_004359674.1 hypothetical protein DFA_01710 [Cavenderia fasciculata]